MPMRVILAFVMAAASHCVPAQNAVDAYPRRGRIDDSRHAHEN